MTDLPDPLIRAITDRLGTEADATRDYLESPAAARWWDPAYTPAPDTDELPPPTTRAFTPADIARTFDVPLHLIDPTAPAPSTSDPLDAARGCLYATLAGAAGWALAAAAIRHHRRKGTR